ncbi:MAG: hypothetical protein A2341_16775 [Deltaproteobacteria bacterium RIFOXYB12_FULL_58_9]|nr:MAG: hypothetical protein A2341_16775 [Deltaproteobacteria bacterium RIFOXYB12_FULL_58_9]
MQPLTETILRSTVRQPLTDTDLVNLLPNASAARRYGLVKRAIAAGELLNIRRGLYLVAPELRKEPLDLFVLAAKIYGPSYISAESALSYHGWIPEQVVAITSAGFNRSRSFKTSLGRFEYRRTPFSTLAAVFREEGQYSGAFLLASGLRALADLAHQRRGPPMDISYLIEGLRIDPEHLRRIAPEELDTLLAEPTRGRAHHFLVNLKSELHRGWSV